MTHEIRVEFDRTSTEVDDQPLTRERSFRLSPRQLGDVLVQGLRSLWAADDADSIMYWNDTMGVLDDLTGHNTVSLCRTPKPRRTGYNEEATHAG